MDETEGDVPLRNLKIGIIIINKETHLIEFVNEDAAYMAESTPEEMRGKRCFGFICTVEEGLCPLASISGPVARVEKPLVKSDGSTLDILKSISPAILNGMECYIETFIDLNEILSFGDLLHNEEERLDRAMTLGRQGIWEYSNKSKELYFDRHLYRMAGYKQGDFPADFDIWLKMVHKEDRESTKKALHDFVSGMEDQYNCCFRFLRKSGRFMWIRARGEKIERRDGSGQTRLLCIHLDIDQEKEREKRNSLRNNLQLRLLRPAPLKEKARLICQAALSSGSAEQAEIWITGQTSPYSKKTDAERSIILTEKESLWQAASVAGEKWEELEVQSDWLKRIVEKEDQFLKNETEGIFISGFKLQGTDGAGLGAMVIGSRRETDSESKTYLESLASITSQITINHQAEEKLVSALSCAERAVDLMNGREARIIEIKKEVNKLLKKSGEKEKYNLEQIAEREWRNELSAEEERKIALSLAEDAEMARKELMESNEQLSLIKQAVNSSSDGVAVSTTDGLFYFTNSTFTSMFKFSAGDLIIEPEKKLFLREEDFQCCVESARKGESHEHESIMTAKDGRAIPVFLRAAPFTGQEGFPIGIIWNITDITVRKEEESRMARDLAIQREMLRKALMLQQSYIQHSIPVVSNYNIHGLFMPCEKLGGDFFKVLRGISEDKILIVVGDCTDHGLKASLDASLLSSVTDHHVEDLFRTGRTDLFLRSISRSFMKMADEDQFPTMTVLLVELTGGRLKYSNANGELPYLIREGKVERLAPVQGMHIGYFDDPDYEMREMELQTGDRLVVYSDAVVEMENRPVFENILKGTEGNSSTSFYSLIRQLEERSGIFPLQDDTTLIQLEYLKPTRFSFSFTHIDEWNTHLLSLKKMMKLYDFGMDEREKTSLAVTELAINAFVHGNKSDTGKKVNVRGAIDCGSLVVTLSDQGEGYDSEEIEKTPSGKGLRLAEEFLSDIIHNRKGNEVTALLEKRNREIITIDKIAH